MSKSIVISHRDEKPKFEFSEHFSKCFDMLSEAYNDVYDNLGKCINGKFDKFGYGICNCSYNIRFIRPEDVASYVSDLCKLFESEMVATIDDVEMFTVATINRVLKDNGCDEIDAGTISGLSRQYINPKEDTILDLLKMCEYKEYPSNVYSFADVIERSKNAKEDYDKFKSMALIGTLKNIKNSIPEIFNKEFENNHILRMNKTIIGSYVELFMLFTIAFDMYTLQNMYAYCNPSKTYAVEPGTNDEVITECSLVKTNEMVLRSNLPFNCDMKTIILKDISPDYADVTAALKFIITDTRSPIAILVNKYSSNGIKDYCSISEITNVLFTPDNCKNHKSLCNPITTVDGSNQYSYRHFDVTGFDTTYSWLDSITYGNSFMDGNYRRDAMGNNKVSPIMNTMDIVYRMYGGMGLKTNEELADHIKQISEMMRLIIEYYKTENIANRDIITDTLVLFGEILTRDILKLYHNNTQVMVYKDKMSDSITPGIMYNESFVMEDTAPSVTFKTSDGKTVQGAQNVKLKTGQIVRTIAQWITKTISQFSKSFNENHKKEIEFINNNKELHNKIGSAIGSGFTPVLSGFPNYKFQYDALMKMSIKDAYDSLKSSNKEISTKSLLEKMFDGKNIKFGDDASKYKDIVVNFALFGTAEKPEPVQGNLTKELWNEIVTDLTTTPKIVNDISKKMETDLKAVVAELEKTNVQTDVHTESFVYEADNNTAEQQNQPSDNPAIDAVRNIANIYTTNVLNAINNQLFKVSYSIYRDIVAGYNSMNK